jgi:hypothetical protein
VFGAIDFSKERGRLKSKYQLRIFAAMKNISISDCDVYRDGGSIGLFFTASGGKEYNLSFAEVREKMVEWIDVDYSIAAHIFVNWIRQRQDYQLFIKTRAFEEAPDTRYISPVIYLGDCNSNIVVKRLDWQQAQEFIAPFKSSDLLSIQHFEHLLEIIHNEGRFT